MTEAEVLHLRSRYVTALETVSRLANQGAPDVAIAAAVQQRELAGDRWQDANAAYRREAGEDAGHSVGMSRPWSRRPKRAEYSRPESDVV